MTGVELTGGLAGTTTGVFSDGRGDGRDGREAGFGVLACLAGAVREAGGGAVSLSCCPG